MQLLRAAVAPDLPSQAAAAPVDRKDEIGQIPQANTASVSMDLATIVVSPVLRELAQARSEIAFLRAERDDAIRRYQSIDNSTIWRWSAPLRRLIDRLATFRSAASNSVPLEPSSEPQSSELLTLTTLKAAFRTRCRASLEEFLQSGERISFPAAANPKVSILMVLFNQAELTLYCVRSLVADPTISAEVIIVDNNSSDHTKAMLDRMDGFRIIDAPENLHFLRGINRAAQDARGDYLLLLNNDTQVQAGAISAAAARLDAEPSLGAVGGPILRFDGRLQEAGCIIWSNGHTHGYGQGRDPADWEFQFRRDVDYCSGAFLMVRRNLFAQLGGFDTVFSPAYYEETDLCMRIRRAGYRVGYEPAARIMHFEYGSAGQSDSAIDLYSRNRAKFIARYASELTTHHDASTGSLLLARMRNGQAGRILLIDPRVVDPRVDVPEGMGRWLAQALPPAGLTVTYCAPDEILRNDAAIMSGIPETVERAAASDTHELSEFLQRRHRYYDLGILLTAGGACLSESTKAEFTAILAGGLLIEIPCQDGACNGLNQEKIVNI